MTYEAAGLTTRDLRVAIDAKRRADRESLYADDERIVSASARRATQRAAARERLLATRLPKDMRCPGCGRVRINSRDWVVVRYWEPRCRRCWHRGLRAREDRGAESLPPVARKLPRSRTQHYAEGRKRLLAERLPQDMRCVGCDKIKIKSRQWVVISGWQPRCRSCWNKGLRERA